MVSRGPAANASSGVWAAAKTIRPRIARTTACRARVFFIIEVLRLHSHRRPQILHYRRRTGAPSEGGYPARRNVVGEYPSAPRCERAQAQATKATSERPAPALYRGVGGPPRHEVGVSGVLERITLQGDGCPRTWIVGNRMAPVRSAVHAAGLLPGGGPQAAWVPPQTGHNTYHDPRA